MSESILKLGIYQHYKGGLYMIHGVSLHTETEEKLVSYQDADGNLFSRPLQMWFDLVEYEGKLLPRFKKI